MAAIDLTHLKQQISALSALFQDPVAFITSFHEILGFYHRYSHRPNKDTLPKSFMRQYDLPVQLIAQIEQGLKNKSLQNPDETIGLARELWQDAFFESHDLAAYLIGQVPVSSCSQVREIILDWLSGPIDQSLLSSIFLKATHTLQMDSTETVQQIIAELLESQNQRPQNYGLFALAKTAEITELTDLPQLIKMLRPFIQSTPELLETNVQKVIEVLAERTPYEISYLLKQVLSDTPGTSIERRMRSYIPFFPDNIAISLKDAIKSHTLLTLKDQS